MTLLQLAIKLKCTFGFCNILCSRYNNTQHKPAAIHDLCCLTDLPFETGNKIRKPFKFNLIM